MKCRCGWKPKPGEVIVCKDPRRPLCPDCQKPLALYQEETKYEVPVNQMRELQELTEECLTPRVRFRLKPGQEELGVIDRDEMRIDADTVREVNLKRMIEILEEYKL